MIAVIPQCVGELLAAGASLTNSVPFFDACRHADNSLLSEFLKGNSA